MDELRKKALELCKTKEGVDRLVAAYRNTFTSPEGALVLADLENRSFVHRPTTYGLTPKDWQSIMALREGLRSFYLHIENVLDRGQDAFGGLSGVDINT